jgi:hypothetical protein
MPEIINEEVVTTTKEPLADYIARKKSELDMVQMEINQNTSRANAIITELEAL